MAATRGPSGPRESFSAVLPRAARYTGAVRSLTRFAACVLSLTGIVVATSAAEGPTLATPDGSTTEWGAWLEAHGRSAVVVWASWTPQSAAALAALDGVATACRDKGLSLVVIAVQEPVEASRAALADRHVTWLHDRHGAFLKRYRLVRVPTLVIIEKDGQVLAEMPVSADSVRRWAPQ